MTAQNMDDESKRWEDMEPDCLLAIFQRLPLEDLTLGAPFVCKSWHKASLDPLCWTNLNFQASAFASGGKFSKKFGENYAISAFSISGLVKLAVARSCGLAVVLKFPLMYKASINDLILASNMYVLYIYLVNGTRSTLEVVVDLVSCLCRCPQLKALALPSLMPEDELRIPQLIGKWEDLEELEMELKPSCFVALMEEISVKCKKFTGLKMSGSIQRSDALAIVDFAPRLKWLDLSGSYLPEEELVVVMKGCGEIERLSVKCCIGFQVDGDVLEMGSGIKEFDHEGSKLCDYYVRDWWQLYWSIAQ